MQLRKLHEQPEIGIGISGHKRISSPLFYSASISRMMRCVASLVMMPKWVPST